jgi:molybdate transport system regulatory protein
MNRFPGHIKQICVEGHMTLIDVVSGDLNFKAVVLESPETLPELKLNNAVDVLFKETEVIIGLDPISAISIRNRILCEIESVEHGKLLCNLKLKCSEGSLHSIITRNAVESLGLLPGVKVWALIKTNEMMLGFK